VIGDFEQGRLKTGPVWLGHELGARR
jgi:hypothetical protein